MGREARAIGKAIPLSLSGENRSLTNPRLLSERKDFFFGDEGWVGGGRRKQIRMTREERGREAGSRENNTSIYARLTYINTTY